MNNQDNFYSFSDHETLCSALADVISSILQKGIIKNGRASLMVSGGSTPVLLFKTLSNKNLPWTNIDIGLVDERWVAADDNDSNEHLVRTHLLQNHGAAANFTGMKTPAETATDGENECSNNLRKIHHPFDVLLLGMGGDGHTASLFPGAEKLKAATEMNSGKICIGITPVTASHERMTLSLPAILAAENIFLHITGQDKKNVLEKALIAGEAEEFPIRFILQQKETQSNFNIYWAQ